jgi:hypothetical protein
MKLQKKKYINYSGKVYDLQVDNRHHSYTVNNITVHNSAAGCLCSYLLGITNVNPLKYNLLFERFLSSGRLGKKVDVEMILINDEFEIEAEKILKISRNDQIIEIKALSLQKNDKILNDEILYKM